MTKHTPIPRSELDWFTTIPDCKVVIDVGARADDEYLNLRPDIELHAFEPNPEFFAQLQEKIGDRPNVHLNNYGLGDVESILPYNNGRQAFVGGDETDFTSGEQQLPMKTLDGYVASKGITQIDFLKIDTEGWDFKVLVGAIYTLPLCRYVQYEHWNDRMKFHALLENDFIMSYIGHRNVFCTRKNV